jgi:hypothetical protein
MSRIGRKQLLAPLADTDLSSEITEFPGIPSTLDEIIAQPTSGSNAGTVRKSTKSATTNDPRLRKRPTRRSKTVIPGEIVVGTLAGLTDAGEPLVRHSLEASQSPVLARSLVTVNRNHLDREVAIAFERGDLRRPIILGVLWKPGEKPSELPMRRPDQNHEVTATVDGDQINVVAENEIVLRCGKAGITLTKAGKILIRGAYLLSRSSGVNRIKGGSVQIN